MKGLPTISAYILCGGKSLRMGEDKGLVLWQGKPMIEWIIEAIKPITQKIHLVTKNQAYGRFDLPLLEDLYPDKGPVGGIFTSLLNTDTLWNLILSCDVPNISSGTLLELIEETIESQAPIGILSDGQFDYPLIGLYSKGSVDEFEKSLLEGKLKLCPLVNSLIPKKLLISSQRRSELANVNTKEDLIKLM